MKAHAQEKVGCGNRAWPIRGMYGIINRGGRNFSIITSKTKIYKLPAAGVNHVVVFFRTSSTKVTVPRKFRGPNYVKCIQVFPQGLNMRPMCSAAE